MPTESRAANVSHSFEKRFETSLRTWDPLADSPLLKWLDPVAGGNHSNGKISYVRVISFLLISSLPPFVLSLLPSRTIGGGFWDKYGTCKDLYFAVWQWVTFPVLTLLMLYGRRALGDMINRLEIIMGVKIPVHKRYELSGRRALRIVAYLGRVDMRGLLSWISVIICVDMLDYLSKLQGSIPMWMVSQAKSGTFFYFARLGKFQPNLAGLYVQLISSPLSVYVLVLLGRLLIEFALACDLMSKHLELHIMPAHPDGCGGLLPIGQMALYLSLPIMIEGFMLTLMALQVIFIWHGSSPGLVSFGWLFYILICPVLFLLPLLPVRRIMRNVKDAHLLRLKELYRSFDSPGAVLGSKESFPPSHIEDQFAVVQLIERTEKMSVWPFDKKTLLRFAGMVFGPIIPLLGSEPGEIAKKLVELLFHK